MRGVGRIMAGALAGGAAVAGLRSVITSASDLNETISKTQTIFGKSSPAVLAWGKNAASSLGLSQQAALDGLSTFGNFFNQIGLGTKETEAMSKAFVTASVDLGSFHNAAPTDVMDALAAATRGEYDSLQKFIPTINAATVELEAMRATGKASAKELTAQDKARAVNALVMKGQGKAAGDFARTQGSLANQTKILKAQFENLKATIGAKLLPIATAAVTYFNANLLPTFKKLGGFIKGDVVPAIEGLVGWFKKYQDIIVPIAGGILAMVAAYTAYQKIAQTVKAVQVAWTAVQTALNVAMAANPIGIVVLALVGLAAALVIAYKKSETFRNIVNGVFKVIRTVVGGYVNAIRTVITTAWNIIRTVTQTVWNAIKGFITNPIGTAKNIVTSSVSGMRTVMANAWAKVKEATATAWQAVKDKVVEWIGKVMEKVRGVKDKVLGAFTGAGEWLVEVGKDVMRGLWDGLSSMGDWLRTKIINLVSNILPGPVKQVLGINSPSRVFAEIGRYTVQGLAVGLSNSSDLRRVKRASMGMTGAIESGFTQPTLTLAGGAGLAGSGGDTYEINITAGVGDPVEIGRQVTKAIDAFKKNGGRKSA